MKVKELQELLNTEDPDSDIYVSDPEVPLMYLKITQLIQTPVLLNNTQETTAVVICTTL